MNNLMLFLEKKNSGYVVLTLRWYLNPSQRQQDIYITWDQNPDDGKEWSIYPNDLTTFTKDKEVIKFLAHVFAAFYNIINYELHRDPVWWQMFSGYICKFKISPEKREAEGIFYPSGDEVLIGDGSITDLIMKIIFYVLDNSEE